MPRAAVVVFAGPSISAAEIEAELDARCLPPAAQGDVYRASLQRPAVIALIDGVFEQVPAVWHKEILWAMAQGIHVFGASSMGALRAAELAPFGMEGVGSIFEAYRDGRLVDDDEVALAHGPAEADYAGVSEPLVNIRPTLQTATSEEIIATATLHELLQIAKRLFYPERSYVRILEEGASKSLPEPELRALSDWLPSRKIDQKHDDALSLLRVLRERVAAGIQPKHVDFRFEWTVFWDRLVRSIDSAATTACSLRRTPSVH
jgi:hypothetical protein